MDDRSGPTLPGDRAADTDPLAGPPAPGEDQRNRSERERDTTTGEETGRLDAYLARTETPLDILALLTLWIVVVPVADFGNDHGLWLFGYPCRLALSFIYAVDMTIRTALAPPHGHYLRNHPVGVLAIVFPPVRVLFSLRLIRLLFQRGNLARFLVAALLLLLNGALMVWLFERDAPGANIVTLGKSVWWSIVTVTTVGYGDLYPVTVAAQVVATFIMLVGIVTVAVITAQVASSFVDQSARTKAVARSQADRSAAPPAPPAPAGADAESRPVTEGPTLVELDARLARIESLLLALAPGATTDVPPSPG